MTFDDIRVVYIIEDGSERKTKLIKNINISGGQKKALTEKENPDGKDHFSTVKTLSEFCGKVKEMKCLKECDIFNFTTKRKEQDHEEEHKERHEEEHE